ncbi:Tr-type G domain-containing protein [Aphelenchoides besseyi]|nr:Tr-type G domain-containing protein [Aphelenchoides besseyi]
MKRVFVLCSTRRNFVRLTQRTLASNQPNYERRNEPSNPRTKKVPQSILPLGFLKLLDDVDDPESLTFEQLDEFFPANANYKVNFFLNQILIKNSPTITITLVKYFYETGRLDGKSVIPAIRSLLRVWMENKCTKEVSDLCLKLYDLLPDSEVSKDVRILLDLCTNKWPVAVDSPNDVYVLKGDVFNGLVVGCLRNSDFKQLTLYLRMFPLMQVHSDPVVFDAFCHSMSTGNHNLLRVYLQHLNNRLITEKTLEHIKRVVRSSKYAKLRPSKEVNGKCESCQMNLVQRRLNTEEFDRLVVEITDYIKNVCSTCRLGSLTEYEALKRIVDSMGRRTEVDKKRPAVVVDLLNLQRGRFEYVPHLIINALYDLKKTYKDVLLIGRHNMLKSEQYQLMEDGFKFFTCHKHSDDDMFAICAALWLGPNTILMSNDRFMDFLVELESTTNVANLFSIWTMNRVAGITSDCKPTKLTNFSNLSHYSSQHRTCHFTVLSTVHTANRKSYLTCSLSMNFLRVVTARHSVLSFRYLQVYRSYLNAQQVACLHLSLSNPRTRRQVIKPITLRDIKSSKEPVEFYDEMTTAEVAYAVKDTESGVLEALKNIDSSFRLTKDARLNKKILLQLASVYDLRPRFSARPSEEKIMKELNKEQLDLFPQPPPPANELISRAPVVTIMGHVDHGKTTLLDALRNSRLVAQEFGGITQHIGAFSVTLPKTKAKVTFLDTPGHAAFKEMRARGARATDIVVLVVAADDGAKDQTVESIKYANDAGVPMVVAINKCDKPAADPARARRSLMEHGIVVEDMGGDVQVVEISALQGTNIDALQETLIMQAEYMDLKSTAKGPVEGVVIESTTVQGLGKVCTMIVKRGTLKNGAVLIAGTTWGKVRTMQDEFGKTVRSAGPSTPVRIAGWRDELPSPGEVILEVPEGENRAMEIAKLRSEREINKKAELEQDVIEAKRSAERKIYEENRAKKFQKGYAHGSTLRLIHHKVHKHTKERTEDTHPTIRLILRTDVDGTLEAIQNVLDTYDSPEVDLQLVDAAVGPPIEEVVEIAAEFNAIIFCFNTPISAGVRKMATEKNVEIEQFNVIYRLIAALKARLDQVYGPAVERKLVAEGHVLKQFLITDRLRKKLPIAGTLVDWGVMKKSNIYRFIRKGDVVYEGTIESLKHEEEFVTEAKINTEVGIALGDKSIRFKEDDQVEVYEEVTVERHVNWHPPGF